MYKGGNKGDKDPKQAYPLWGTLRAYYLHVVKCCLIKDYGSKRTVNTLTELYRCFLSFPSGCPWDLWAAGKVSWSERYNNGEEVQIDNSLELTRVRTTSRFWLDCCPEWLMKRNMVQDPLERLCFRGHVIGLSHWRVTKKNMLHKGIKWSWFLDCSLSLSVLNSYFRMNKDGTDQVTKPKVHTNVSWTLTRYSSRSALISHL